MLKEVKTWNGEMLEIGEEIRFSYIWSGDGDIEEILESECLWVADHEDMPVIARFKMISFDEENPLYSIVKILAFE